MIHDESRKRCIAERIGEARRMAGLSQSQVAKLLGLHRPSISELEAGRRSLKADEATALAEIFDVDVKWLLCETEGRANLKDARAELAARELSKLSEKDLDRLMMLLSAMRRKPDKDRD